MELELGNERAVFGVYLASAWTCLGLENLKAFKLAKNSSIRPLEAISGIY